MKNIVTFTQQEYNDILTNLGLAKEVLKGMRKSKSRDYIDHFLSEVTRLLTDQTDHELEEIRNDMRYLNQRLPYHP